MSKKSGKKMKWVIPFAVLSITCAAAGVMTGCKDKNDDEGKEHVHAYEWKYDSDGTEHWKECPEDGTMEEGSRGEHVFVAGECECGAVESTAEKKYGTVSGTVKLHKLGGYETDYTGVTIDMGDDVEPVLNKDTGEFTVENVEVGKNYTLKVSKPGYKSYTVSVQSEENENVTIGGQRGIVLEYEVFGLMAGWDEEYHDLSYVNEAEPYLRFKESDGNKTLNVITNDSYNEVAATLRVKYNNSLNGMHTQGILLRFEDGKHLIVRYHNGDQENGNIQYVNAAWAPDTAANSLYRDDANLNEWGERPVHTLTSAETAAIKAEDGGLDLTLVIKDCKMTVLFDGKFVSEYELPEDYANKKVKVGYFAWNTAGNAIINYGISEELPAMQTQFDINVEQPEGANCAVTVSPEKQKYAFGEEVELTVTAPDGYLLNSLTINGEDKFTALSNGKLTLIADSENIVVNAAFVEKEDVALDLTVKGRKLGETVTLAAGTKVKLSGIKDEFTVNADGKITADSITKGRYTLSADGYTSKEINITSEITEVVLEYDTFRSMMNWNPFDNSKQNENEILGATNDVGIMLTNDKYDEVAVSVYLKGTNFSSGNLSVMFRFVDDKGMSDGWAVRMTGKTKVEVYADVFWEGDTGIKKMADIDWKNLKNLTDSDKELYDKGELKLTALRKGAVIYVFLNDEYIGNWTLDEKYAAEGVKVEAGFEFDSTVKGESKGWKFEITDDATKFPGLAVSVNDGTAKDAHGSITITPAEVKAGETVTVTVTPDAGYILDKLTVSGGATLVKVNDTTYTFVTTSSGHTVTATFMDPTVTITDGTADDANGSVSFSEGKLVLGDTVTITVTPDSGYLLASITVTDASGKEVALTEKDGVYTFVAADTEYTVTATFELIPENTAEATVSGVGLGNAEIDFEGETVILTPATGAAIELTVEDGKISRKLPAGEYTLSKDGYYDVKVTVGSDGTFEETEIVLVKVIFKHNSLGDAGIGDPNKVDYTHAATDGYVTAKETTDIYAFTVERYEDAVFSATFKKQNNSQGLFMAFGKENETPKAQQAVGLQIDGNNLKFQGDWLWGLCPIAWWKWEFGPEGSGTDYARPMSDELLTKYANEGITISYVRKDGALYVFVEDELYAIQVLGDYGEKDVCFAIWASNAPVGYEISFTVSGKAADVDKMLADVTDDNGVRSVLGNWNVTENTIAVTGNGFVEFTHSGVQNKESLTVNLKGENSNAGKKAQGILYRFADGKWLAIRIERANNDSENRGYVQFSEDALVPTGGGCLKTGWGTAGGRDFTADELAAFDGSEGLELTLVRDGRYIHILLDGNLLETVTLDEKYAEMDGVIGATIESGTGTNYSYSHKVGNDVTLPGDSEPEVTEPEVTEPEVTEPEVTEPEVTEPEVTEPEVTEPEVTEPEV